MISALCVDDDPLSLELVKEFLEVPSELHIDTATSGEEALDMMSAKRYDAIISDYMMPEMDGLELFQRARRKSPDIPFILFTGRGREEVVIEAFNAGVTSYVRKGADVDVQFIELGYKVKQAVARRRAEDRIRMREQQDRMAMDLVKIARWEYDVYTRLYRFDDMFYELYGTDAEREGGYLFTKDDYVREFVHPDDVEYLINVMSTGADSIPPDGFLQTKHRIIRRDGKVRKILVRVGKMVNMDGPPDRIVGICMDITEE